MGILAVIFSVEALILFFTLVFASYIYLTWHFGHWKKKGVFYLKTVPFFGCKPLKDRTLFKISLLDMDRQLYEEMAEQKFGGFFEGRKPFLLVKDPEIMKNMFVKNFDHFVNRRTFNLTDMDPIISKMMSLLENQEWKNTRALMTPTFTSGKLKKMTFLMTECADQMIDALKEVAQNGSALEVKDFFNRFTMDVIATTAFGIQSNSIKDPNNEFFKMANKIINPSKFRTLLVFAFFMISMKLFKFFRMTLLPTDVRKFFVGVVRSAVEHREKTGIRRNDFLQLMIDAQQGILDKDDDTKNKDDTNTESQLSHEAPSEKAVLNDDFMVAQCFLFFLAGLETVSTLMSLVAYELAVAPEIQQKLQKEIDEVLGKHDGKCTYDAIQEMEYLDMVIQETIRKNPPATRVERRCNKRYQIPETDVILEPGDHVMMSIIGQHFDKEYFPDPEKFDPERFNAENRPNIHPYMYMPFGHGPRNCIGNRFALIETKIGLACLLHRYSMIMDPKTDVPYKLDKLQGGLRTQSGIWVKFNDRKH